MHRKSTDAHTEKLITHKAHTPDLMSFRFVVTLGNIDRGVSSPLHPAFTEEEPKSTTRELLSSILLVEKGGVVCLCLKE